MNEKPYPFTLSRTEYRYEFVSVSSNKEVRKIVLLSQTEWIDIFNLALLDILESGEISDISESRNNDLGTVLATVIQIIDDFLSKNPHKFVLFTGSDSRRHRLYRIIIGRELKNISEKFIIFGVNENSPDFFKVDTSYEFYLIGNEEGRKLKLLKPEIELN